MREGEKRGKGLSSLSFHDNNIVSNREKLDVGVKSIIRGNFNDREWQICEKDF